ncbi:MAG: hypothetical protein WB919_18795 [Candidatus Sulfotelmatobacter sp.]
MAKAARIGGAFFRSKDSKALYAWYEKHLGIERRVGCFGFDASHRRARAVVAFSPADSDYFPLRQPAMLNFRVDDLDALLDVRPQLESKCTRSAIATIMATSGGLPTQKEIESCGDR